MEQNQSKVALEFLWGICKDVPLNHDNHSRMDVAFKILGQAIAPKAEEVAKVENGEANGPEPTPEEKEAKAKAVAEAKKAEETPDAKEASANKKA